MPATRTVDAEPIPTHFGESSTNDGHGGAVIVRQAETLIERVENEKEGYFRKAIAESGYRDLRNVRARVISGVVHLTGCVSSYYLKQVAQEAIRPLAIGLTICNRLTVGRVDPPHAISRPNGYHASCGSLSLLSDR
ncbi:hypothetical protein FF011L_27570 [Roseimaritima multifibrata]|uniref:BON domain-containing protein n=1 Tax=Roseimaritima multifibrata TaxID=1930274 RepID=A0A517MGG7_9BACT|nr:BON domain-containing protein [Roseimaritima multifibrata]QDS93980.1 hypothetical protein FF011L_27570 [Roseimaritima multifibrata]